MSFLTQTNLSRNLATVSTSLCRRVLVRKRLSLFFATLLLAISFFDVAPLWAQNVSGITVPAGGSAAGGDVIIQGTAVIEPFQKYELAFKREPNGDDAYAYFDGGTSPVVNGSLGIWRTTGLEPGIYSLRLRVVKLDGNYAEFYALNISVNQQAVTETPTTTPTPSEVTPTPIPTASFTPGPSPTPNIGQVQQPLVVDESLSPTDTPTAEAVAIAAPANDQASTNAAIVNPENVASSDAQAAPASGIRLALDNAMSMERLRSEFWRGVRISATLCLVGLALVTGRQIYSWSRRRFR